MGILLIGAVDKISRLRGSGGGLMFQTLCHVGVFAERGFRMVCSCLLGGTVLPVMSIA